MSGKRVSDMTNEEIRALAGARKRDRRGPVRLTEGQQYQVDRARAMTTADDESYDALLAHVVTSTGVEPGKVDASFVLGVALVRMRALLDVVDDLTSGEQ